jgi:AraC-like DNA-binding protein
MDYYCKHFEGDELKKILADLVEEIFYNIIIVTEKYPQNKLNGNYTANPIIASVIEYIDNNISRHFTIEDLCNELFVSKSYLHQLFLRHMQMSPQKYVNSKRLLMAQKEIRAFAKPTEVFAKCGFSDYSSFYRAYKKFFGYPPSEEHDRKIFRVIDF